MFKIKHKAEHGKTQNEWLDSTHIFSYGQYKDLQHSGYSDLQVLNDNIVAAGGSFGAQSDENMELICIVLDGVLEHKDSMGHIQTIKENEIQVLSAGTGVSHTEFNPDDLNPVHFIHVQIVPEEEGLNPSYNHKAFDKKKMLNNPELIVSGTGEYDSVKINQDAKIYQTILENDTTVNFEVTDKRKYWIHVAKGKIEVNSNILDTGDCLVIEEETETLHIQGLEHNSNFLIFDLRA